MSLLDSGEGCGQRLGLAPLQKHKHREDESDSKLVAMSTCPAAMTKKELQSLTVVVFNYLNPINSRLSSWQPQQL